MKKKISLLLCMLAAVFALAGCTSKNSVVTYDKEKMGQVTEFLITYCTSTDEAAIEQWNSLPDSALETQFLQAGLPFKPESFLGAMEAWQAGVKECGDYVDHGDFKYEASKTELTVTADAAFAKRDATITIIYKADVRGNLYLDSLTVDGEYSMGEILKKAGLNTLLGMGTVFVVLIIISLIISLMKYIPVLQEKLSKKQVAQSTAQEHAAEAVPVVEEQEDVSDDGELVAVIAAAIAASEGTSTDGFVVRSIRRRKSNKWNS